MPNPLIEIVHDGQYSVRHATIQCFFSDPVFRVPSGQSLPERALNAYAMLRRAAELTGPARALTRDRERLLAFYEWACVHAPDLLPLISGHYNLTVGSLLDLGRDQASLEPLLADLDTASAVGVLLINEYGCGSNVAFLETTATYDHATRCFTLDTPHAHARKFMPNVAAPVPRVTVVAARLVANGRQHGVFLFVLRMRGDDGSPAEGVTITPMPDKPFFPMDNAVISFDGVRVPYEGWLTGGIAEIDERDGKFRFMTGCGPHDAFRQTSAQFTFGRIALSSAAVASARAAVLILARYAQGREVRAFHGHQRPMLSFRNVQQSLCGALADVYAATFLANHFKARLVAAQDLSAPDAQLCGIVAKAHLVTAAHRILQETRERCGAQAMFSANRIADYLGLVQGSLTAEGDIQVLRLTAGRYLANKGGCQPVPRPVGALSDLDTEETWLALFRAREAHASTRVTRVLERPLGDGTVFDRWNLAIPDAMRLCDAYADRLTLEAFLEALNRAPGPEARAALRAAAQMYALRRIAANGGQLVADGHLSPEAFHGLDDACARVSEELVEHLPLLVEAFGVDEAILDAPATASDRAAAWEASCKEAAAIWTQPCRTEAEPG
ncbi:acyl-CoA dehydrogenase [Streptomyces avermitilis]|uniref:acyl-CoA dehydrogenase family protein n=1 Tax=Streptomyces avermitilis TaxID=33903 RepID=UPI0033AC5753